MRIRQTVALILGAAALAITAGGTRAGTPSLQQTTSTAMHGRSGTAVVVEVATGRVLAAEHLDVAARRLVYPGSAVKPFTLMALLQRGVVAADTQFVCPGRLRIGGRRMDCAHGRLPGPLDAASALAYSCNNYFAHFGARLRDADLTQAFAGLVRSSGWAEREASGSITTASGESGLEMKALGEAGIQVTPLGMLAAYRELALRKLRGDSDPAFQVVYRGLEQAVEFGTGQPARAGGLAVAGKTGTARASEGAWTHGWFAGIAPAERPEIAVVVFLERGRGLDAAAIAGDILRAYATGPGAR